MFRVLEDGGDDGLFNCHCRVLLCRVLDSICLDLDGVVVISIELGFFAVAF